MMSGVIEAQEEIRGRRRLASVFVRTEEV